MKNSKRKWLGAAAILTLQACGPTIGSENRLESEYRKSVWELGLFPVYPPREQIQVGDVYLVSGPNNASKEQNSIAEWIGDIAQLRTLAATHLASRLVFDASEDEVSDKVPVAQKDLFGGALQTRGDRTIDKVPILSLPITSLPQIEADAGRSGAFGVFNLLTSLGLAGAGRTTVVLNFNDVRSYWVPLAQATSVAEAAKRDPEILSRITAAKTAIKRKMGAGGEKGQPCAPKTRKCKMVVVTQVYLSRQISYTYRNSRIFALGAQRSKPQGEGVTPPAIPVQTVVVSNGGQASDVATTNDALAAAIRVQLASLPAQGGGSVAFESFDGRGLTFSRRTERPVAVAWDGVEYLIPSLTVSNQKTGGKLK